MFLSSAFINILSAAQNTNVMLLDKMTVLSQSRALLKLSGNNKNISGGLLCPPAMIPQYSILTIHGL
jgi:hypothetical protein